MLKWTNGLGVRWIAISAVSLVSVTSTVRACVCLCRVVAVIASVRRELALPRRHDACDATCSQCSCSRALVSRTVVLQRATLTSLEHLKKIRYCYAAATRFVHKTMQLWDPCRSNLLKSDQI
jgi:hypothetical protein